MDELTNNQSTLLKNLCANAYEAYDKGDFKGALRLFYQAWVKLPKPQTDFEESGWVLTGIGDTYFRLSQLDQSLEALNSALHCPGTEDNPFVILRIGQCHFNNGQKPLARKFLHKAYLAGGEALFKKEDPAYLVAIKDLVNCH